MEYGEQLYGGHTQDIAKINLYNRQQIISHSYTYMDILLSVLGEPLTKDTATLPKFEISHWEIIVAH